MNLAEATSALSKKESEKTVVLEEIEKLRDLRDEGSVAILHATVISVTPTSEDADVKLSYQLFEENQSEVSSVSVDQSINDPIRFNLASKTGRLVISVVTGTKTADELDPEAESTLKVLKYTAEFGVSEIPEDGELRTDVPAVRNQEEGETTEETSAVILKFKASVDDVTALIASKELELSQLEEEFAAIVTAVQEAKKKQATKTSSAKKETSAKKTKKTTRTSTSRASTGASASSATSAGDDEPEESGPSLLDQAVQGAVASGAFVLQKLPYVFFGVAAVGIYAFGDYASV